MGLALLAHASMSLKYWDEAFLMVTYLINCTPTKLLAYDTPLHNLLGATPDYSIFRVFGCACWPNLHPYNSHKLQFRSTRCVFLGTTTCTKGSSVCIFIWVVSISTVMFFLINLCFLLPLYTPWLAPAITPMFSSHRPHYLGMIVLLL
jgi:hypothetical protein